MTYKVACVVGTRPEAIKMAPVIQKIKENRTADCVVLATAQHRQMLDQVLAIFDIVPDVDLNIMRPNQSLTEVTARLLIKIDDFLISTKPDIVLAQGDTTTVMTIALACFYHNVPFGHVEAGLRTWDIQNPFPEEMNRIIAGRLARWHFAPTSSSRDNLLKEGINKDDIFVTGNTVIDALKSISSLQIDLPLGIDSTKRIILVTAHRRENFGAPIRNICRALISLADQNEDIQVCYPVHPNPSIKGPVEELLEGHPRILLLEPLEYVEFVGLMKKAHLILSDSGGIQEEAPALGKPVLVLRNETERPEAISAGTVKLIGSDTDCILTETQRLLDDKEVYNKMSQAVSPYGDGHSAERIVSVIESYLLKKQ